MSWHGDEAGGGDGLVTGQTSTFEVANGEWSRGRFVYDGTTVQAWHNADQIVNQPWTHGIRNPTLSATNPLRMFDSAGQLGYYNGNLDEVEISTIPEPLSETPFSMGVYMYDYQMANAAFAEGKTYSVFFEEHMAKLKANGVNSLYLATGQERFSQSLSLAKQYNMTLVPQLDFAYFNSSWTDPQLDAYAQVAGDFINANDDPAILAWSVKEEADPSEMDRLAEYYTKIRQVAPNAEFNTIHRSLTAAQNQTSPDPAISGTDRYAFWWEVSGGGYLASPASALNWTRAQAALYQPESAQRGADFMLVTTQGGLAMPAFANLIANDTSNQAMMDEVRQLAEDGRMGWKVYDTPYGERFNLWKWYRSPENSTKALAWIGVLEGAKHVFNWHYDPTVITTDFEQSASQATLPNQVILNSLAGDLSGENPELTEFGEASQEIRAYERIITNMTKLSLSPVDTQESYTHVNAFSFPGLNGKVVVVQNSNVGTWPTNKFAFADSDPIFIDDEGNLVGYVPFTNPMTVNIAFKAGETPVDVFDIATGLQIPAQGTNYGVDILPGSGKLLFLGTSAEALLLHGMMGAIGAGDFDDNGVVDGADFLLWQRDPNIGDLADWEANYGAPGAVSAFVAQVPEPAGLLLMLLGMAQACRLRTWRG